MGVRFPHGGPFFMTDNEVMQRYQQLIDEFGDKLPNPEHCPKEFAYYVKLYTYYEKHKNETNNSGGNKAS
jgi:hypothetical protein